MNICVKNVPTRRANLKIVPAPIGPNFRIVLSGVPADINYIEFTRNELDLIKNTVREFPK
ncbi:hypothetical protein ES705_35018 [subsurface metagenome]